MGRPKKSEPTPDVQGRVTIVNWKGQPDQREYLDRVSRETMIPLTAIIRAGTNLWLKQNGRPPIPGTED